MRYSEICNLLNENYELVNITFGNNSKITDVKVIDCNMEIYNEKTLYVGNYSCLIKKPNISVMMLGTEEHPDLPAGSSYSLIKSSDLINVFNVSKELIIEDLRSEAALFELTQEVLTKKSLLSLMNSAASLLGNAIILTDGGQKVLAHSSNYEIFDPLWAENVERGYCSYEFIQKVRLNQQMKEWSKLGSDSVLITLPGDKQPKLVSRIIHDGHITGSLIMIEHHTKITHAHYKQLPLVGNILFESFNYDSSAGIQKSFYTSVLYTMLDEKVNNKTEIINVSKLKFPKKMQVVVAQFAINIKNRYLKFSVKVDLERIFPEGYSVLYKSYIVILVRDISEKQKQRLNELSSKENLNMGISWWFTDISEFKRHFQQAVTCIKQTQYIVQDEHVHEYSDFSFYDMLLSIPDNVYLHNFCHPALKILNEYGQDFYLTLKCYLECNKNVNETADRLFIHRNTLNYRIKRIKELTDLDLDNPYVVQSIMDSYRIQAFLNRSK